MLGIHTYLWRLVPANPILLRVVDSGGKRLRDAFIRWGYLGILILVVIISLLGGGSSESGTPGLSDLAKTSGQLFKNLSYFQLALVALLAPVFTAGAITQEKDSQTYDILLSTPLTNGQIVLGSLLSRMFFIVALLISGIPIFSITQIFGGVSIASIVTSFGLAVSTAFAMGALAMAIATFKVGTRRTIFSFYLFIIIFMGVPVVLDQFQTFHLAGRTVQPGTASHVSWFTGINPFLALRVVLKDPTYAPPYIEDLPAHLQGWPLGWYFTNPTGFYISVMFSLSLLLVLPSIVLLRRMAQSSVSIKTLLLQKLRIVKGDRTRKPRGVWSNPIAWREARTKASAARATILRYAFMLAGIGVAVFILWRYLQVPTPATYVTEAGYGDGRLVISTAAREQSVRAPASAQVALQVADPRAQDGFRKERFNLKDLKGMMEVVSFETADVGRGEQRATVLTNLVLKAPSRGMEPEMVRKYLLGAVMIEFAIILLIVTNAAASTVTREKEDGTLDLLLSSPITSRYYIWGKLRGLVSFVLPLVAIPVVSVLLFVVYDLFRSFGAPSDSTASQWVVFPEAVILMPGMLIIIAAFAAILGMQMSLRCRTTVMAVMSSVGIVVGAAGAMAFCGYNFLDESDNAMALAIGSFSPFTLMQILIDPYASAGNNFIAGSSDIESNRAIVFFCSLIAVGVYTAVVWSMYTSMVKNFDMTIRKQSR